MTPGTATSGPISRAALAAPAILLVVTFVLLPLAWLVRFSLAGGGGVSGFGIGGGYTTDGFTLAAYGAALGDRYFREVASFTLVFGAGITALPVLVAFPAARAILRLSPGWRALALGLVVLPKIANLLVLVFGLELMLGNAGPIVWLVEALGGHRASLHLLHGLAGVVIGKTYLLLPYAILVMVAAFSRIDPGLAQAARGLGAGAWRTFWRVELPLSVPGLSAAATITLIWGLGAFVTPYLLGSPDQITLAVDIQHQAFENVNLPRAAAEACMMLVLLGTTLAAARVALRRMGA